MSASGNFYRKEKLSRFFSREKSFLCSCDVAQLWLPSHWNSLRFCFHLSSHTLTKDMYILLSSFVNALLPSSVVTLSLLRLVWNNLMFLNTWFHILLLFMVKASLRRMTITHDTKMVSVPEALVSFYRPSFWLTISISRQWMAISLIVPWSHVNHPLALLSEGIKMGLHCCTV